jgi:hypothetical protein
MGNKKYLKNGQTGPVQASTHGWRATAGRWTAGDQRSPAGCRLILGQGQFVEFFLFFKKFFEACPLYLEV